MMRFINCSFLLGILLHTALLFIELSSIEASIVHQSSTRTHAPYQRSNSTYPLKRWPPFPEEGCTIYQKASRSRLPSVPPQHVIHDNFIIAMIVMGPATHTHVLERCVASLRTLGQWLGYILVVTDAPSLRYQHLVAADENIVFEFIKDTDLNKNLIPKMQYQRFKTQLPDLVHKHTKKFSKIQYILYTDVDVVFGDNVESFMGYAEQFMWQVVYSQYGTGTLHVNSTQSFLLGFTEAAEQEHGHGADIHHMGIFIVHRQRSKQCLQLWQDKFDTGNYTHDQPAMTELIEAGQCIVPVMHREAFLMFPTVESMRHGERAVFVHITNTNRAKKIEDRTEYIYLRCTMLLDQNMAREVDSF